MSGRLKYRAHLMSLITVGVTILLGCDFTRTVEFRHAETRLLMAAESLDAAPTDLRIGPGAVGILMIPDQGGFRIEMPLFFADFHEEVKVMNVSMLSPRTVDAALYGEMGWRTFDPPVGSAKGSLRIGEFRAPLRSEIETLEGEVVLQVRLQAAGVDHVLTFTLDRIVEWWPPNA